MAWNACTIDLCELARLLAPAPHTPIGMIGHSMGGGQILTAAATMPERFAWLVNLDGLGPPAEGFADDDIVEVATRNLDEIDKVRSSQPRPWRSRDLLAERRGAINIRLPRTFLEHLVELGTREVEGGFVWKWDPAFRTGVPDGFSLDLILAQYRHVTAPTLVLVSSEEDAWTEVHDEEAARRVAMLQDGRLESVPGAGHYVHVEQPDYVLDRIVRFLDEIGARP
jgi:pimeloyl-ACP methyl ester carboxylesterase